MLCLHSCCVSFLPSSSSSAYSSNYELCPCKLQVPNSRYCHMGISPSTTSPKVSSFGWSGGRERRGRWSARHVQASMKESPYDVLGISSSSSPQQIKRAYRKLALKYHPDVNREANAQEKFMRIKHAYNTLININKKSDYSSTRTERSNSWKVKEEEEFYGFGDLFRDLQVEFQNWEGNASSQDKPKSLWEELSDIGEEFVEFLEKELNITDTESGNDDTIPQNTKYYEKNEKKAGKPKKNEANNTIEDNIDEIEAALAQLKRELGL